MAKYTQGKLEILTHTDTDSKTFIEGGDNGAVASTYYLWRNKEECEANAERLASCWNALLWSDNPQEDIKKLVEALKVTSKELHEVAENSGYANTMSYTNNKLLPQIDEALALYKEVK